MASETKGYALAPALFKRVMAAMEWVENFRRFEDPRQDKRPVFAVPPGVMEAVALTSIPPCNGTTYGIGYVNVYIDNTNTNTMITSGIPNNTFNGNAACFNWFSNNGNSINANTHIMVGWYNGNFRLVSADC